MRASASIPLKPLDLRRFLIVGLTTGSTTPNDTGCIFLSTCRHKPLLPFSVPSVEESEGMEGRGSPGSLRERNKKLVFFCGLGGRSVSSLCRRGLDPARARLAGVGGNW